MRNLITDIAGLKVGHAHDEALGSGATAIVFDEPAVAACDLRGGGPGTRETELLAPAATVERIDALTLSGGSAFGLDSASGVQAFLREQGRGFAVGPVRVPIVPAAIVFDLLAGSGKGWGRFPPYRELGYRAAQVAGLDFALGSAGAGLGATVADLKGGVGSASDMTADGLRVGAIVVVNAVGRVTIGDGPHFWAAPFEHGDEFGGRGWPARIGSDALALRLKGSAQAASRGATTATTIALVATDAVLTKTQAHRLAVMAQTGLARAIYPVHTPLDGDIVFAAATGRQALPDPLASLTALGALAANTLARAVARAVYEASALPFAGSLPSWRDRFG